MRIQDGKREEKEDIEGKRETVIEMEVRSNNRVRSDQH